jgi:hypothetical protein
MYDERNHPDNREGETMSDTERLDKLERALTQSKAFDDGIAFVPYVSIQTELIVFAVLKLTEGASVMSDEILSSQPSLRAAIDAL